jgi:hypothetical protein
MTDETLPESQEIFLKGINRTRMTQMLRIYADVLSPIRIDPQHPGHPRSIRLV